MKPEHKSSCFWISFADPGVLLHSTKFFGSFWWPWIGVLDAIGIFWPWSAVWGSWNTVFDANDWLLEALEWRFGRPDGVKLALERRFGRPDGAK